MIMQEQTPIEEAMQNIPPSIDEDGSPSIHEEATNSEPYDEQTVPDSADRDEITEKRFQELLEAMDKLKETEQARKAAWEELQKTRKHCLKIFQYFLVVLVLALFLMFYQEIGQVGWNWFCQISALLNSQPQTLVGLLTFLAAMLLFGKLAKWTFRAALDDLFGEDVWNDDLDNR